ncbi:MAG: metallophosphoesterase [Pedobacter sp.]|nr:MAG: metallophosphoesterase [Pedobacter sp.]
MNLPDMTKLLRILSFLIYIAFFTSCDAVEYSPNQKFNKHTPVAVNEREIKKLSTKTPGSKIKVAITGDTQRNYKESIDLVRYLNALDDIDFVVLNGDISDFGLLLEFNGIYKIYDDLKMPFISVVGNHDLVANGKSIYMRMFGPLNFSFIYGGIKFICHDTNGREYNFDKTTPNIPWLKAELKPSADFTHAIAISHVPSTDGDFDPNLASDYEALMNADKNILASIHSHQHQAQRIYYTQRGGTPFIITNAIVNRSFTLLEIENGTINAQEIKY